MVTGPPSSVWLFSRGALTPMNQLCPWRDSPSMLAVSSRWLPRSAISSESLADQEWGLPSYWGACPLPSGLLLPGYLGPQIRFWRRCYLRGRPEVQVRKEDRAWEVKGLTAEPDVSRIWKSKGLGGLGSEIPFLLVSKWIGLGVWVGEGACGSDQVELRA